MGPGAKIEANDVSLTNISHETLTKADWKMLERAAGSRYNRVDPQTFVAQCHQGLRSLWRVCSTDLHCLIGLQVQLHQSGARTLHISLVAGKGYFRYMESILLGLKAIADWYNCEAITGTVVRPGMLKKYKPLGIEPVCEVWSLKL